jgi:hypothetical protein
VQVTVREVVPLNRQLADVKFSVAETVASSSAVQVQVKVPTAVEGEFGSESKEGVTLSVQVPSVVVPANAAVTPQSAGLLLENLIGADATVAGSITVSAAGATTFRTRPAGTLWYVVQVPSVPGGTNPFAALSRPVVVRYA